MTLPTEQRIRVTPLEWAIAMKESHGRRDAHRHEKDFRRRYIDGKGYSEVEAFFRATSFGLWQIMGENLRRLGWKGQPREWRTWCADIPGQLASFRRLWDLNCDDGDDLWRNVCAWNVGDAGEDRLSEPTAYWFGVKEWLDRAPTHERDGSVPLLVVWP